LDDEYFKKKISPNIIKNMNRIAKIESAKVPLLLDTSSEVELGTLDTDIPLTNQLEWIS